jgi:copper chaperone CopZ
MTSATYQVTGMTCGHCTQAVGEELRSIAGVRAVAVELVPGGVSAVTVSSDRPLERPAVESALAGAGDYRLAGDTAVGPGPEGAAGQ